MADRPDDGCCTLGAHFSDKADRERVKKFAKRLPTAGWQFAEVGRREGVVMRDGDGDRQTRTVDGACVFLNRPGFPGGAGCALHNYAADNGLMPLETKPDVCWQLPIRRSFEDRELPDGTKQSIVVVSEFDRRGWGPGGHDLNWYCSGNTEAHVGPDPVYLSERDTLVALMGTAAYDVLVGHCEAHLLAVEQATPADRRLLAVHPADPA